jgi:hypothetical protein
VRNGYLRDSTFVSGDAPASPQGQIAGRVPSPSRHTQQSRPPLDPPPADADAGAGSSDAADDDNGAPPPPMALNVAANGNPGVYLVDQRAVRCLCAGCVTARLDPANAGYVISPTEFERHSGIPAAKKWRFRCAGGPQDGRVAGPSSLYWEHSVDRDPSPC